MLYHANRTKRTVPYVPIVPTVPYQPYQPYRTRAKAPPKDPPYHRALAWYGTVGTVRLVRLVHMVQYAWYDWHGTAWYDVVRLMCLRGRSWDRKVIQWRSLGWYNTTYSL